MSLNISEIPLSLLRHGSNLNGSDFLELYGRLMVGSELDRSSLVYLLSRAVLFLRADDENLNKLGYRIVLQYSVATGDYEPLYQVAAVKDYAPILEALEVTQAEPHQQTFLDLLVSANRINFAVEDSSTRTVRTRGQLELRSFAHHANFAVVVAPTSYGKSEMMRERIHTRLELATAIMVPTKSLIAQTRTLLVRDPALRNATIRVVTHPEGFVEGSPFVAVMTQERLFRLFRENPDLQLSQLLIDEAHNLLSDDRRAEQASEVILTALHRNPALDVVFFTPFMADPATLSHVNIGRELAHRESKEHVKVERYYYTDSSNGTLHLYDQFLKRSFVQPEELPTSESEIVNALAGGKNLVYLNRPRQAEDVAISLAASSELREDPELETVAKAIADHVHPDYKLIDCLKRGVVFHHGAMPEVIRLYVEELFSSAAENTPRMLVSTSTLLEGVNTPADTLFVLNPWKGPRHLTPAQFRNLTGRVGRFREIFAAASPRLGLLQPRIFVLDGPSAGARFNPQTFLDRVADVTGDPSEQPGNALLEGADSPERRHDLLERLENLEPGASGLATARLLETEAGRAALAHGADDYDLFEHEQVLQGRVDEWQSARGIISSPSELVDAVSAVFLKDLPLADKNSANLARIADNPEARAFYSMFLDWRARGMSLREMVAREISFFKSQVGALVYVGSSWGDRTLGDGWQALWMDPQEKSEAELATLAVAKVKEEQDFVDFFLMRYVEALRTLGLVGDSLYYRIKYGTDDPDLIMCVQNGVSLELAKMLLDKYTTSVHLNRDEGTIRVDPKLATQMEANSENEILVFEASRLA